MVWESVDVDAASAPPLKDCETADMTKLAAKETTVVATAVKTCVSVMAAMAAPTGGISDSPRPADQVARDDPETMRLRQVAPAFEIDDPETWPLARIVKRDIAAPCECDVDFRNLVFATDLLDERFEIAAVRREGDDLGGALAAIVFAPEVGAEIGPRHGENDVASEERTIVRPPCEGLRRRRLDSRPHVDFPGLLADDHSEMPQNIF